MECLIFQRKCSITILSEEGIEVAASWSSAVLNTQKLNIKQYEHHQNKSQNINNWNSHGSTSICLKNESELLKPTYWIALLWHYTSSLVRFFDLVFLRGAGGLGNPCYGVQARTLNFTLSSFALHFKAKCQSKAMLP